jgi:hypothetical protein
MPVDVLSEGYEVSRELTEALETHKARRRDGVACVPGCVVCARWRAGLERV